MLKEHFQLGNYLVEFLSAFLQHFLFAPNFIVFLNSESCVSLFGHFLDLLDGNKGVVDSDERNKVIVWKTENFVELFVFEVHRESDINVVCIDDDNLVSDAFGQNGKKRAVGVCKSSVHACFCTVLDNANTIYTSLFDYCLFDSIVMNLVLNRSSSITEAWRVNHPQVYAANLNIVESNITGF